MTNTNNRNQPQENSEAGGSQNSSGAAGSQDQVGAGGSRENFTVHIMNNLQTSLGSREGKITGVSIIIAALALFLPIYSTRINRVAEADLHWLTTMEHPAWVFLMILPLFGLVLSMVQGRAQRQRRLLWLSSLVGLGSILVLLGLVSSYESLILPEAGRLGISAGWLLFLLAMVLPWFGIGAGRLWGVFCLVSTLGILVLLGSMGSLDSLGIMKEAANQQNRLAAEIGNHLRITLTAVSISGLLGISGAFVAYRSKTGRKILFSLINLLQTIPTIALFGLLMAPLAALGVAWPWLRELGIRGIGDTPAIIALSMYALFPILRNSYEGLNGVGDRVLNASRGMGMTRGQLSLLVILPTAAPVILYGLRIALVQTLGNAVLAKLVGAGGLGVFVFEGLGQNSVDMVLLGIIMLGLLTLVSDGVMRGFIWLATPRALRHQYSEEG